MPICVTDITRADRAAADALGRYGVATVHEAQGRTGLMHQRLRPIFRTGPISGTAVTCTLPPGDNWMIHVAAEQVQEGDILVAAPIAEAHSGYFGDLLGTLFQNKGVRGLIIDAGCRDVDDLEKMGFPVWARSICAHGTVKETVGDVNVPVSCGDTLVNPGDVIVADNDGVVVVPRADAASVAEKAQARIEREETVRARYAAGELGIDINDMRPRLAEKGLTYMTQADYEGGRR
ncbi:4-hydroxy-4-methyl-2-oxoglutarate aldolase [Roseivivax jejudonensis]|uniref:4-hydroxy-4-methyl-2-oxoglutarate aldolase n=1 Tax=Roseivivax jejudonensis TaxID=1529041 RepID=A0A1X6ZXE2_9RHOB|nr:4-carboxy-4-hydroxy-2-oxoadipate aldolase/oxaloacetate decarboxylase [Roseivivax jejudonensis]SLN64192.1 4-hydroxy-4-methyl-2-oxoglutarate aldolase [Roseivivax jejudonensis]